MAKTRKGNRKRPGAGSKRRPASYYIEQQLEAERRGLTKEPRRRRVDYTSADEALTLLINAYEAMGLDVDHALSQGNEHTVTREYPPPSERSRRKKGKKQRPPKTYSYHMLSVIFSDTIDFESAKYLPSPMRLLYPLYGLRVPARIALGLNWQPSDVTRAQDIFWRSIAHTKELIATVSHAESFINGMYFSHHYRGAAVLGISIKVEYRGRP
jgi:hypothetical protein